MKSIVQLWVDRPLRHHLQNRNFKELKPEAMTTSLLQWLLPSWTHGHTLFTC